MKNFCILNMVNFGVSPVVFMRDTVLCMFHKLGNSKEELSTACLLHLGTLDCPRTSYTESPKIVASEVLPEAKEPFAGALGPPTLKPLSVCRSLLPGLFGRL